MDRNHIIQSLNTDLALGSDTEVLEVLVNMSKNKLYLLHRLIIQKYINRKESNDELKDLIQPIPKSNLDY